MMINHNSGADEEETNPLDGKNRWTKFTPKSGKFPRDWNSFEVADCKRAMVASLAFIETDSLFCTTALKIEDGVGGTSLREEGLLWFQLNDSSSQANTGQKRESVECHFLKLCHLNDPRPESDHEFVPALMVSIED